MTLTDDLLGKPFSAWKRPKQSQEFGDKPHHLFHGNQHTGGISEFDSSHVEEIGYLKDGKAGYNASHGFPAPANKDFQRIVANPARGKRIADDYSKLPLDDPNAHAAYQALANEVDQQYDYLTKDLGVDVKFTKDDPYKDVNELSKDLRDNHSISVLMTEVTGPHPFLSNEENDKFRAVHDAFGHAAIGRGFDRNGEEAAYQSHAQMFSPLAMQALATETRGQNSSLVFGGKHEFPPQKVALLPPEDTVIASVDVTTQADADEDNNYTVGRSHHTSLGRWFPTRVVAALEFRDVSDESRDAKGRWTTDGDVRDAAPVWAEKNFPPETRMWEDLKGTVHGGIAFRTVSVPDYERIQREGEINSSFKGQQEKGPGLYVTSEPHQLVNYGHGEDVVLAINVTPDDVLDRVGPTTYQLRAIPSSRIVGALHQSVTASLPLEFYTEDEPRDIHGRWAKEGYVDRVEREGGMTFHPKTGAEPTSGYLVAKENVPSTFVRPASKFVSDERSAKQSIKDFIKKNAAVLDGPNAYVGIWHDRPHDEVTLDVMENLFSRDEVIKAGQERNQQSVWDVVGNHEIPTGGTGNRE